MFWGSNPCISLGPWMTIVFGELFFSIMSLYGGNVPSAMPYVLFRVTGRFIFVYLMVLHYKVVLGSAEQ